MKQQVRSILTTLLFILTSLSLAIITTLLTSPIIYRLANQFFHWQDQVGISQESLLDNYQRMIDYLIFPAYTALELPDFSFSTGGLQHFAEVKLLFQLTMVVGIVCIILSGFTIYHLRHRKRKVPYLKYWLKGAFVLPLLLLFVFFIAFDQVFISFHHLLFRNDLWLFDPLTDPIIQVLPQFFFMILFIVTIIYYAIYLLAIQWSFYHKLK